MKDSETKTSARWLSRTAPLALSLAFLLPPGLLRAQSAREELDVLAGPGGAANAPAVAPVALAAPAAACGARACGASRYGVIVNGDTEERHRNNADAVYRFMRSHYGIPADHIYFLSTRRGPGGIQRPATAEGLLAAARALYTLAGPRDELVVYTTGHGALDENTGETYLGLADDRDVSARDFAGLFLAGRAGHTIYFGDQCDSGGFAKAMADTDKKVIALSSTDDRHDTVCGFFIDPYLQAFDDPANDDDPKDGVVSEWEAFKAAKRMSIRGHAQAIASGDLDPEGATPAEMAGGLYLRSRGYETASAAAD